MMREREEIRKRNKGRRCQRKKRETEENWGKSDLPCSVVGFQQD